MASEVASEVGKTILEKVIDPLANYVSTHASYTLRAGHHVQVLETEIERLKKKRSDVKDEIQRDERAGKVATDEIQGWLEAVDKLENDAGRIISRYRGRKCMCLGACSLDCFSNHSIGAGATNVSERVREESGRRDGFTTITKEAPLPAVQLVPVETLAETSRSEIDLKLGEALDFLRSDREASLGIWGMGGVGKTTLLRHINNALAKDPSFERVILVTASRDCTVEKIQKLIVKDLKLESAPENHKNDIYNYLSKKNFVILLDDLWARLDLLEVGVPPLEMLGGLKQKLILTTRNQQVCRDMGIRRRIKVDCLSRDVARLLFLEEVGEEVINSDPQKRALAEEVADECGGLPKAIICIARAMSGKRRSNLWEKAIKDLKTSNFSMVPGTEDPLPLLKVSYDYLEDPATQESLLLCALWPEDYHIPKEILIDCWMGHGLLGEFESMDEANNNGEEIIDKLEKASLLEYIEDEEDGGCRVSLHDLIRDMALWIARDCGGNPKKWIVLDKAPQDEKSWMEARKMSIMDSKLTTLPSVMCSGSNLTTLILRDNNLSHGDLGILQHLHQLVYLDLSHNQGIRRIPIEICHLQELEFLNLSWTMIYELPDQLQKLRNLKYLLMEDTNVTVISSELLSSLVSLEVLNAFISYPVNYAPSPTMINNIGCLKKRPLKALSVVAYSMSDLKKLTRMSAVISVWRLYINVRGEEDLTTVCMLPPNSWSKCEWLNIDGSQSPCTEFVMDGKHIPPLMFLWINSFRCLTEIVWKRVEPRNMNIHVIVIGFCPQLKHVTWLKDLPFLECLNLSDCTNLKQVVLKLSNGSREDGRKV